MKRMLVAVLLVVVALGVVVFSMNDVNSSTYYIDDWIYFSCREGIMRVKSDGTELTNLGFADPSVSFAFAVYNNKVFTLHSYESGSSAFQNSADGMTGHSVGLGLITGEVWAGWGVEIADGWIYFYLMPDYERPDSVFLNLEIARVNVEGTVYEELGVYHCPLRGRFTVSDGYIYSYYPMYDSDYPRRVENAYACISSYNMETGENVAIKLEDLCAANGIDNTDDRMSRAPIFDGDSVYLESLEPDGSVVLYHATLKGHITDDMAFEKIKLYGGDVTIDDIPLCNFEGSLYFYIHDGNIFFYDETGYLCVREENGNVTKYWYTGDYNYSSIFDPGFGKDGFVYVYQYQSAEGYVTEYKLGLYGVPGGIDIYREADPK